MRKLKAIIDLTRIDHGIMLCIAILIGSLISGGAIDIEKYIFAFLTALMLEIGTFSLNDYFDYEVDKKNKRMDRPLVRGDISPTTALAIYFIASPVGIVSSLMVNKTCFIIALISLIFATLYDVKLKEIKIVGNFYIAFMMAIPFIFGAVAVRKEVPVIIYFFAFLAFFSGVGREIIKDVMDFEGDKLRKTKSFPTYLGIKKANLVASIFIISAVILSFLPFLVNVDKRFYLNPFFLIVLFLSDSLFIYSIYFLYKDEYEKCRKLTLLAMIFGLFAFLAGATLPIK
ncbi:MAG: prenyltransferase [Thermoplasmata archaeon]|nr:MAG: prenyltransferase [Thermoplasmata archaeon]